MQSMGLQKVGHDLVTEHIFKFTLHMTPVFEVIAKKGILAKLK